MRSLIYAPLADDLRAPIYCQLTDDLMWEGHEVAIILEDRFPIWSGGRYVGQASSAESICRFLPLESYSRLCYLRHKAGTAGSTEAPPSPNEDLRALYREELEQGSPEEIYLWNGGHTYQADFIAVVEELGWQARCRFLEAGWIDPSDSFYIDPAGVGAAASFADLSPPVLNHEEKAELSEILAAFRDRHGVARLSDGERTRVLVVLQPDGEEVARHSPFADNRELLRFLQTWLPEDLEVTVRPHPDASWVDDLGKAAGRFTITADTDLHREMARTRLVVGINGVELIQALAYQCDVIAFGRGVFSGSEAVLHASTERPFERPSANPDAVDALLYELVCRRQKALRESTPADGSDRLRNRLRLWGEARNV